MASLSARVALVGRRLPHNENLGLAYLRAALEEEGARVAVHHVNDAADLARAVASILATSPAVVGLSLADGGSALLPLALGEMLSRAGYRGHITCGGQFATLARGWLLERYPWLDSVVRFAGEGPIVAITARVAKGDSVFGVPGVTTREGDGPPADVLDPTQITLRPRRDELPEILGHKAAHIAASRGCQGRCAYCGPAALQTLERKEGARAGLSARALQRGGVGGVRRRELEAVSDEMAELFHARGVRYFYFVDEHLLPYSEPDALDMIARWKAMLAAREVGPFGVGAMLRADRLTPAIARAFADFGLVRAFIGLEIASEGEARRFGRKAPSHVELSLLRAFAEAGVTTVSNLMLLHPSSTPATIAVGLDLLAQIPAGVFEATRMMVYHGTRLHEQILAEGRLVGNPLRYGYTFEDPAMERFAEIFTRLRGEAFRDYSIAYRTHDAHLALSLARRIHPDRVRGEAEDRLEAVRRGVNELYVSGYRRALDLALSGGGFAEAGPLVAALREPVLALERELDRAESMVLAKAPRTSMFAPLRAAAASVFAFTMSAAPAGCGGNVVVDPNDHDAGAGGTSTTGSTTSTASTSGTGGTTSTTCPVPYVEPTEAKVQAALAAEAQCFAGSIGLDPVSAPAASFYVDAYGTTGTLGLGTCATPASDAAAIAQENQAKKALADACISTSKAGLGVFVQGGAQSDIEQMLAAIEAAC